jgi:membrane-associated phospholipid phosphatase
VVTIMVLLVVAVTMIATIGLPVDHLEPVAASAVVALALGWGLPGRGPLRLVADWVPVALALFAYVMVQGAADGLGVGTNFTLAPRIDRDLTGVVPTVWLQAHMYATGYDHWWNAILTAVYDTHFVVTPLVLAWLWSRAPERFYDFRRRLLGLTFLALAVFIVHPTAPPWLAANHHVIGPIVRTSRLGTTTLHLHAAPGWVDSGVRAVDQVAAFPSLHAGLALIPLTCLWRGARVWTRVLLVAYPLAMGFTLVATGEHWLSDVLAAWLLAWLVHYASSAFERRRSSPVSRGLPARNHDES